MRAQEARSIPDDKLEVTEVQAGQVKVSAANLVDQEVVDLLKSIEDLMLRLEHSSRKDYTSIGSQICRYSRRILWAFVCSESCGHGQVTLVRNTLQNAAHVVIPSNSDDPELVAKFVFALQERVELLNLALAKTSSSKSQRSNRIRRPR